MLPARTLEARQEECRDESSFDRTPILRMSGSSGGLSELMAPTGGLKRCGGGMSSPSLGAGLTSSGGLPRTLSTSALRVRPQRRPVFWEYCFETPPKRDL